MLIDKRILNALKNTKIPLAICAISFAAGILFSLFYHIPEEGFLLHCAEIVDVVTSEISVSYYIKRLICEILILTIVFACGFILYCIPFIFVIILYKGFLLGLAVKMILVDYSVGGLAISLFIVIPAAIISFCALAISCVLACNRLNGGKITKCIIINDIIKDYFFCFIIAFASVLYILLLQIVFVIPLIFSV